MRIRRSAVRQELKRLLSGGDRRSIARSNRVHRQLQKDPRLVADVAGLANDADWLVSMRAMDLLEKLAREHADLVQPHKRLFIGPLAESDRWEIRLQIVRALPLLRWTPRERRRVLEILQRDVEHPQIFVRAWALDSLARFAPADRTVLPAVMRGLGSFEHSGKKALVTRARHIRARLSEPRRARPLWICPECGARLVSRNLWHSCGQFTLEALFADSTPEVAAAARKYVALLASLGDVQILPQKTRLVAVARVRFAGLQPRRNHFMASFALDRWLTSPRIARTVDYGPRWRVHYIRITSRADMNEQLRAWLQESHDVVGMQRDIRMRRGRTPIGTVAGE
jgi:hypothetical protein